MSSISKTPSSVSFSLPTKNITDEDDDDYESPEESGWTTYFEDFFNNNNNNHNYCSTIMDNNFSSVVVDSCCCSSSSLVSDAASLYATKFVVETVQANSNNKELSMTMRTKKGSSKGSSSMKRNNNNKNIRKGFIVDALEDTASSPLNSPKVLYEENQLYKVNKYEQHPFHQEKGNGTGIIIRDEERKELGFKKRDSDYTELNKKGLCLVPLSMVINHI
ncbi:hypothetical protein PIB30_001907 [Stylosanthes scabra]|uniref:Uncharacterized protein n=1 Tax=Stylosanthes scabra TaxID=79078 RepID=A0ABU6X4T5_9FABA|nr:hypothetical protein [Stylosanthes scabra]